MLALSIFPGSRPPSIVDANELNFCVRDGNRWTLIAINTNSYGWDVTHLLYQNSFEFKYAIAFGLFQPAPLSKHHRFRLLGLGRYTLKTEHRNSFCFISRDITLSLRFGQAFGLLVSVSYTHYCASTSDLSTT